MKMNTFILIALCILVLSEQKSRKHKKGNQPGPSFEAPEITMNPVNTQPTHIQEMIIGNPNNMVKDRHPLWRDFKQNQFDRPFMHGVVGPQWEVPLSEDNKGFNMIASPMPKPQSQGARRIQPNYFPPTTYSASSFDMPLRKDVIQADIPMATIRTVEQNIDPRNPPKKLVARVSGTLYHGTGSVDESVVHGTPSFIQKHQKAHHKSKSHRQNNHIQDQTDLHKSEALVHSKSAEARADKMLGAISNSEPHMILGISLLNSYEQPELTLHEHNAALQKKIEQSRNTAAGVRAAHTFRKLQ